METWILYYHATYEAVPWPFPGTWDDFLRQPQPLLHAVDDLGRQSPRDYLSETPAVPVNLPRGKPVGRYALAIYHDRQYLYVLLHADEGAAIPGLEDERRAIAMVNIISADARTTLAFTRGDQGQLHCSAGAHAYGGRAGKPGAQARLWDFAQIAPAPADGGGVLCCWRIARASIAEAFVGPTLRLSVSRTSFRVLESVAWGAYGIWGPRLDEMGTVLLVDQRRLPPWPVLRRVELDYEPSSERGRFRAVWDYPYAADEQPTTHDLPRWNMRVPWERFGLRVGGKHLILPMPAGQSAWLNLPEGYSPVQVSSAGGPAVHIAFEKRSGRRIIDNDLPPVAIDPARVEALLAQEAAEAIAQWEERQAGGQGLTFVPWASYLAASLGRLHHDHGGDARLLEVLREAADFHLSLQRDDGTYAGYHLRNTAAPVDKNTGVRWSGGAYDTGPAGELWVVAAWLLGDEKYLAASRRLVEAYATYRIEFNHNYAAFALYHLAAHYRLTREPLALEHGVRYARDMAGADILPLGFQSGHNYYSEYGGITLRGLAQFCAVLPAEHSFRPVLRERCVRMANQLISRQQDDGRFDARSRYWLDLRLWVNGLFSLAFLLEPADVAVIDRVVGRMLQTPPREGHRRLCDRLTDGDFVRYWVHRQGLLRGEAVDLLSLI